MATVLKSVQPRSTQERSVLPGIALMGATAMVALMLVVLNSDAVNAFPYLYLLPWIIALALVLAAPSIVLYYQGRLKFYNPIVFATWVYFFPSFVLGGLMLAGGWSQPYYLSFIQDADYNLPYTVVLIMLGHAGLSAGYFFPLGRRLGESVGNWLPSLDFDTSSHVAPGIVLLAIGTLNTFVALLIGVIGYQKSEVIESYTGIVFLATLFWMQGSFILWYLIFRRGKLDNTAILLSGLLLATTIGKALISGNRGALLGVFVIVILAFTLAGGRFNVRRTAIAGTILSVCLLAGMIYGTTFRNVKGSESQVSLDQYTENIFQTFDEVGKFDLGNSLEFALMGLAQRLDTLSSVAVVVSNYEQLAPYEESYGLDNNIWKDLSTFFVPRILWADKPIASEPRRYSDLYFNYGENSFAITPVGDLIRNYGPVGVPVGMFLFGILLRFLYRALIENRPRMTWRATFYFMLLMSISYEGFYGLLIPLIFKVGFTAFIGLLVIALVARSLGHTRTATPN